MRKREIVAAGVLVAGGALASLGVVATYGLLREYADVCGTTPALTQIWASGAGLGPLVAMVALGAALLAVVVSHRRATVVAAAALVLAAVVGATVAGVLGIEGKQAAYEDRPEQYGGCGGYNS